MMVIYHNIFDNIVIIVMIRCFVLWDCPLVPSVLGIFRTDAGRAKSGRGSGLMLGLSTNNTFIKNINTFAHVQFYLYFLNIIFTYTLL